MYLLLSMELNTCRIPNLYAKFIYPNFRSTMS